MDLRLEILCSFDVFILFAFSNLNILINAKKGIMCHLQW